MRPAHRGLRAAAAVLADVILCIALAAAIALAAGCGAGAAGTARTVATHVVNAACVVCTQGRSLLEKHPTAEELPVESCSPELAAELEELADELEELEELEE